MFNLIPINLNIDFVGKRYIWMVLSSVLILATFVLLFTKGLNYGIDFTGGAEIQVRVPAEWDIGRLRAELEKEDIKGLRVQQIGMPEDHDFLVRAQGDEQSLNHVAQQVEGTLLKTLQKGQFEIERVDVVGPAAGDILRKKGFLSMFYALLVILLYVTIRFDSRYAPGAVLALFHDTVITLGIFIITQKQFDLTILAALLALIGYSNNDTIIIYDRVRETLHNKPGLRIEEAVNRAMNETLGRTIMTSLTTFLVVVSLWIWGGSVIENFAFTMMVGIVVGAYSSIFVASSIVIFMTRLREKRELRDKMGGGGKKKKREYQVRPEPKLQP